MYKRDRCQMYSTKVGRAGREAPFGQFCAAAVRPIFALMTVKGFLLLQPPAHCETEKEQCELVNHGRW